MEVVKAEIKKLRARKSTKVLAILYGVIFAVLVLVYFLFEKTWGLTLYNDSQFISSSLSSMMAFMLPLLTIYVASQSFVNDFSTGAIKNMFLVPISKDKLFVGKVLSVVAYVGILLLIQFTTALVITLIFEGGVVAGILTVAIEYLSAFLVLTLIVVVGALLALVLNNVGLALLVAYVGYFGLTILNLYAPNVAHVSLPAVIGNYDRIINSNGITLLLTNISYTIMIFIAGLFIFEKKEDGVCQSD